MRAVDRSSVSALADGGRGVPGRESEQQAHQDGRVLRRARNREAVIDAVIALMDEGVLDPAMVEIVERSQVSERSVFRYFENLDELRHAVVRRTFERSAPLLALDVTSENELDERIRRFVTMRVRFCEAQRLGGRLATAREHAVPAISEDLRLFRDLLRAQVSELFSPELRARPAREREQLLGAIFVLATFESWDLYSRVLGRSRAEIERALVQAIGALLS